MTNKLLYSDVYEYDFKACFHRILKNSLYENYICFDEKDKLKRNINIGLMQKKDPDLSKFLRTTSDSLVSYYLNLNNMNETNIIWKQTDGFIVDKKLDNINSGLKIDYRGRIIKLVFDINKKAFLSIMEDGTVKVRGIQNKLEDMSFYDWFAYLNFYNRKELTNGLELIRKKIFKGVYNNINWYIKKLEDNTYLIPIKNFGLLKLNKASLNIINPDDIDVYFIWDKYIWIFGSIIILHI